MANDKKKDPHGVFTSILRAVGRRSRQTVPEVIDLVLKLFELPVENPAVFRMCGVLYLLANVSSFQFKSLDFRNHVRLGVVN
jgi:hypothetical protein